MTDGRITGLVRFQSLASVRSGCPPATCFMPMTYWLACFRCRLLRHADGWYKRHVTRGIRCTRSVTQHLISISPASHSCSRPPGIPLLQASRRHRLRAGLTCLGSLACAHLLALTCFEMQHCQAQLAYASLFGKSFAWKMQVALDPIFQPGRGVRLQGLPLP